MIDKPTQKAIRDSYMALPMEQRTVYVHKMAIKYNTTNYTIRVIIDGEQPGGWQPKSMKNAPLVVFIIALLTITTHAYIKYPTVVEPCEVLLPDTQSVEIATLQELPKPVTLDYFIFERTEPIKTDSYYQLRDWERKLIERVLMSECPYEPPEGQRAVAQVIIDRLLSPDYPDTVYEVLNQPNQFASPSEDDVNDQIREAVSGVWDRGERVTDEPLYWFYAPRYGYSVFHERQEYALTINNHKFYR